MPYDGNMLLWTEQGKKVTLFDYFKYKLARFKDNFKRITRKHYHLTITKGENLYGGQGKKLKEQKSHEEIFLRRRQKRWAKKEHHNRCFFLNLWRVDGEKTIIVRITC